MPEMTLFFALGLAVAPAISMHASESVGFDAPSGEYVELYGGAITTDLFVGCDFRVEDTYDGTDFQPSLALIYSTSDSGSDESQEMVKLEAVKEADEKGWRYFFTIIETGDRNTQIVAVPQRSEAVLRLSLARSIEGDFLFLAGNDQDNTSAANVSRLAMIFWRVIASGVKGSAICSNTPTDMPDPKS